jgi:hypothetical protein
MLSGGQHTPSWKPVRRRGSAGLRTPDPGDGPGAYVLALALALQASFAMRRQATSGP